MSERYRVEPTGKGFWPYCVRAGNGTRDLYVGHKKTCDRVAAELTTAFRDGEFVGKGLYDALAAEAQALREEVAALRARVVVVPERKLLNSGVPGLNRNSGWNACLDELSRLNGKTVSEGLLRRVCAEPPATCCMDDEMTWRRDLDSALTELRAMLSEQA